MRLPIDSSLVNAEWNNSEDSLLELINQDISVFSPLSSKTKHTHISLSQSPPAPFFLSISSPPKMSPLELPPKNRSQEGGKKGEGGGGKEGKVTHHRPLAFHKMHTH